MSLVEIECRDGIGIVALNRPEVMNALSGALQAELYHAVDALDADAQVRVLIVTGRGRAFCAGLDLNEVASGGPMRRMRHDPIRRLESCGKPTIAAINGAAITGGLELALACDILIASDQARFADTHVRVGVLPGWGMSHKLPRLVGIYRAKELSFSCRLLDASTAAAWGLVNRVVSHSQLLEHCVELAIDIARVTPDILQRYKALLDGSHAATDAAGITLERLLFDAQPQRDSSTP